MLIMKIKEKVRLWEFATLQDGQDFVEQLRKLLPHNPTIPGIF